ncbi:MAG TPA: ZIP family metal transporter, partial [Syntrophorhabdaceae bacterium]|nr:ZIP family metal transporter [Syntrophorhabdaceae bacterium]
SVPIFYATGNRKKAFIYSFSSGLAEPLGAAFAYMLLAIFLGNNVSAIPPQIMGILLNCIAGIMVYISLDELLPTSRAYGRGHDSMLGLIAGMAIMAISLLLMKT